MEPQPAHTATGSRTATVAHRHRQSDSLSLSLVVISYCRHRPSHKACSSPLVRAVCVAVDPPLITVHRAAPAVPSPVPRASPHAAQSHTHCTQPAPHHARRQLQLNRKESETPLTSARRLEACLEGHSARVGIPTYCPAAELPYLLPTAAAGCGAYLPHACRA